MRFGTAIERLVDNYEYAKSKIWIRDEVAWALYHTWKEADDRKTEPQTDDRCIGCKFTDGEICYCPEDCEVCDRDGYKTENSSEIPNNSEIPTGSERSGE